MATLILNAFLSVVPLYLPSLLERYSVELGSWDSRGVNYLAVAASGGMVLLVFVGWMARVAFVARSQRGGRPVQTAADICWYAFRFYPLAHFLK